jgi:Tol biopolymer transport system component
VALGPGQSLGPYDILSALGAGGMGEVYRARDRKLNRDVALKILPASLSTDPDRIARFEREARVLASLNHPNIGHIYGLEDSTPVQALVLELIDGDTLQERMANRPMALDRALPIAWQIADALAAAHGQGVIHRDLKPANVKVRPDGTVKVLDFGLAKALEPFVAGNAAVTATAARLSPGETQGGVILGSAAYMSPEQARGEPLDSRTDIWSFGVVLFEMLSGTAAFGGRSATESLAAVLHLEPDFSRVPARVRPLLEACLQKDAKRRLRDIGDARLLVRDGDPLPPLRPRRSWLPWAITAAFATLAAVMAWAPWRGVQAPAQIVKFHIVPQGTIPISGASALSPDGRYFAYMSTGSDGVMRVRVRDLRSFEDRVLQGTEIRQAAPPPFFSPDSRYIAYDAGGALMKVEVGGGLPQTICPLTNPAVGGSWSSDGVILFGDVGGGIRRVAAAGGTPAAVTVPDPSRLEQLHLLPVFLPDGRHFFYQRISRIDPSRSGIYLGSLDAEPGKQDLTRLIATPTSVKYAPALDGTTGHLLLFRDGNLFAQRFDERRLQLSGTPEQIVEGVHSYMDGATVTVSHNGVLAYLPASADSRLSWFDRKGRPVAQFPDRGPYGAFTLSSDGNRVLAVRLNPQAPATAMLWLLDFATGNSTRLAAAAPAPPVWSHDGSQVVFAAYRSGGGGALMRKRLGGASTEDELLRSDLTTAPTSWSRDARHVLYVAVDPATNADIWTLSLEGTPKATPFIRTNDAESQAQFSPGSTGSTRWVAFTRNESGRDEVYLTSFPDATNLYPVSRGGGHSPRWRPDGRELFYVSAGGMITAVPISDQGMPGQPTPLFPAPAAAVRADATGRRLAMPWDVAGDGERFLFTVPAGETSSTPVVVLNWQSGLAGDRTP